MKIISILNFLHIRKIKILGLTRIRNEELIIKDSLDAFSKHVDGIIVYDDCSTDNTINICKNHPKVLKIIKNYKWESTGRELEETKSRKALLDTANLYKPEFLIYIDADERLEGKIKKFLLSKKSNNIDGIKIRLFDSYITKEDKKPYIKGKLWNFRKYFGPEYRDILMIWKNNKNIDFIGIDAREPIVTGNIITKFYCQHYGKSLSIEHWEETCNYYANFFPMYSEKWKNRKGKAIHINSDFESNLYTWKQVKNKGFDLTKMK